MTFAQVRTVHGFHGSGFIGRLPVRYAPRSYAVELVWFHVKLALLFVPSVMFSMILCMIPVSQGNRIALDLAATSYRNARCLSRFFLLSFVVVRTTSVTNSSCMYTAGVYD